jgi:hypothetical protein
LAPPVLFPGNSRPREPLCQFAVIDAFARDHVEQLAVDHVDMAAAII